CPAVLAGRSGSTGWPVRSWSRSCRPRRSLAAGRSGPC
ncbi:MAG: hypothetical protein AVDCRST_MAG76-1440, partial [uncultured Acidimicrobiales bacterium]